MNIWNLFKRKPVIDAASLVASAEAVRAALLALEAYMEAAGDKRGLAMVRKLHRALEAAWIAHAPAVGGDVSAFSGGTPKELPQ